MGFHSLKKKKSWKVYFSVYMYFSLCVYVCASLHVEPWLSMTSTPDIARNIVSFDNASTVPAFQYKQGRNGMETGILHYLKACNEQ